jgi:hypothetical protein
MSQFTGRQSTTPKGGRPNKGIMRARRAVKRHDAEVRTANTPLERTRQYRILQDVRFGDWSVQDEAA